MAKITVVREHIAWSYANLAAAHSAVNSGTFSYGRVNYMVRAKLFKGLVSGSMSMRTLLDDEKVKYRYPKCCCYCGATSRLHMDHLIARSRGGPDSADNVVWSCISCNSSKGNRDVLVWLASKNRMPSILLLRRYLKLVAMYCEHNGLLDLELEKAKDMELPFELMGIPYKLPNPGELKLWVAPVES